MAISPDETTSKNPLANERFFLVLVFFIGSTYSYGPLLNYPLYLALAAAKGQEVVGPGTTGAVLMGGKLLAMFVHSVGSCCGTELRPTQTRVIVAYAVSASGLVLAASTHVTGVAVLLGVNTLNFIQSRVLSGTLFVVPSEERTTRRTFVYDASCQAGCLWTALVIYLLQRPSIQESWSLRVLALNLPLMVSLMAWAIVQPDSFYSPGRMDQAQQDLQQVEVAASCNSRDSMHGATNIRSTRSLPVSLPSTRVCIAAVPLESSAGSLMTNRPSRRSMIMTPSGSIVMIPTGFEETLQRCSRYKSRPGFDAGAKPTLSGDVQQKHKIEEEEPMPEKLWVWRNARFRVIASTFLLSLWSFNFYMYTVFPGLIAQNGPPLSVVSTLYTAEGALVSAIMAPLLPYLQSNVRVKFFVSAWGMVVLPVVCICFLGRIHWVSYMLTLLCMDLISAMHCTTLGVVLLRCLPWGQVGLFYAQVSALGGCVMAVANLQVSLREVVGHWPGTCAIGHGMAAALGGIVYATHQEALREIMSILAKPTRNCSDSADEMEDAMQMHASISLAPSCLMRYSTRQSLKTLDEVCTSTSRVLEQTSKLKQSLGRSDSSQQLECDPVPSLRQEVKGKTTRTIESAGASQCSEHGHRAETLADITGCGGSAIVADFFCFVIRSVCSTYHAAVPSK